MLTLPVTLLENHDHALDLPRHETPGSAGMDLRACLASEDRARGLILPPMGRALVPTGLAVAIPAGHEGQVRPRSGLAVKTGITVLNSPGTIDSDYRGELRVLLINLGAENQTLAHGERIAQLIIAPYATSEVQVVTKLDDTDRGGGGFGSTGVQ
ncbi:MAG: dUTP diphosphatase [Pseudomonadota bacterium]